MVSSASPLMIVSSSLLSLSPLLEDFDVASTMRSVSRGIASPHANNFIKTGIDHVALDVGRRLAQSARAKQAAEAAPALPTVAAATHRRANPPIIIPVKLVLAPSTTSGRAKKTKDAAMTDGTMHPIA